MVEATEEIEAPSPAAAQTKTAKVPAPPTPPKQKLAGTPQLITPVNATPAQVKAATASVAPAVRRACKNGRSLAQYRVWGLGQTADFRLTNPLFAREFWCLA